MIDEWFRTFFIQVINNQPYEISIIRFKKTTTMRRKILIYLIFDWILLSYNREKKKDFNFIDRIENFSSRQKCFNVFPREKNLSLFFF